MRNRATPFISAVHAQSCTDSVYISGHGKKLMAKMLSQKQRYNLKFLTYEASEAPLHAFIKLSILVMPNPSESTHELWRWMMWRIDKSKRGEIFITVLNIVSHLSDA